MNYKNKKQGAFLVSKRLLPRPIVLWGKRSLTCFHGETHCVFMFETSAVWRGQKGNGKGNLFPWCGQKMDISAHQFPSDEGNFPQFGLITSHQGK
jgi:hypothetical protein